MSMYMILLKESENQHMMLFTRLHLTEKAPSVIKAIEVLTRVRGINVKEARRRIADKLIADNSYKF